jgi:hypothetical protein
MRAIFANEIMLPPNLEVLCFMQEYSDPLPFPLVDQHRARLVLEQRLPALRAVTFTIGGGDDWVRDHDVWTRNYSDYFDYPGMRK